MISIVIPLYNKEADIASTLKSVLAQTYQDFEIIVIDDGSTDNSTTEVKKFNDSRIRLISQFNAGVSAARNRGIEEAQFNYIAFLDADDEWLPEYLSVIYSLITKYPNCNVYATSYTIQNNSSSTMVQLQGLSFSSPDGILDNYFSVATKNLPPLWTSAVCAKKESLQNIGGFPIGIKSGEDLLTWAKLSIHNGIAYSKQNMSIYHNEIQAWEPGRPVSDIDVVGNELLCLIPIVQKESLQSYKYYIAHWYGMRASTFLRHKKRFKAFKEVLKALRMRFFYPKIFVFLLLTLTPDSIIRKAFKYREAV
ncbi:glycosyltransferase family 2 protein [Sulfuricurvum sp.]|uniref:glycosyltransferase family 2 protein n=1 Tax=Sulfuricurvum sp. TaxID=2025608 RepID=UPI00263159B1|nr:glycosyltransferase family 2 protein [Sulfuricurvum sp.]MDD3595651.1 glycosyltransferase [Sulfuricurvum sp.]